MSLTMFPAFDCIQTNEVKGAVMTGLQSLLVLAFPIVAAPFLARVVSERLTG